MRRLVCQLALAGGKSQSQIAQEFDLHELTELLCEKDLVRKESSKADIRHAFVMSGIAGVSGNKIPPSKFVIKWDAPEFDKEENCKRSKAFWGGKIKASGKV